MLRKTFVTAKIFQKGTIFTFVVVELARLLLADYCSFMYWENFVEASIQNWIFGAASALITAGVHFVMKPKGI